MEPMNHLIKECVLETGCDDLIYGEEISRELMREISDRVGTHMPWLAIFRETYCWLRSLRVTK